MLDSFQLYASLKPNLRNSSVVFPGGCEQNNMELQNIRAIPDGPFPVKYSGVPLIAPRLRAENCKARAEKILSEVQSWSNTLLSYGTQLINSVLFSVRAYRSSMFVIPQKVLKEEESTPSGLSTGLALILNLLVLRLIGTLYADQKKKVVLGLGS